MTFYSENIDPNWCIVETNFDIAKNRHYESVLSLGTGFMTTRASIEEGFVDDDQSLEYERHMDNTTLEKSIDSKSRWGTFMPVIQAKHPTLKTGIVNLPFYLGLIIIVDGEKFDLTQSKILNYCRWLNLYEATLYRTIVWETKNGKQVDINWRRFMDPSNRFSCVQDINITVKQSTVVTIDSFVDTNVRTNGFDKFSSYSVGAEENLIYSDVTTNLNNRVVTATQCYYNFPVDQSIRTENRKIIATSSFVLENGQTLDVRKISFTAADTYFPSDQLLNVARKTIQKNGLTEKKILHQHHLSVWETLWKQSDIQIDSIDQAGYNSQLAIRSAIFHLLKAKGLEDRGLLDPKGTTTEMYYGSVFWDFEIFILPFFIYTHPEIARTAPNFRYHGLDSARQIAQSYGYGGAKYPWQSDCYGNETCVPWQYADHQVHISADVVLGIWHYVCATDDKKYLYEKGAEIIFETARYWKERVDKVPHKYGFQLLGVMGPDEYKPITNNNAYTNFVARMNLELAVRIAREMKVYVSDQYNNLCEKIKLCEEEIQAFEKIAAEILIPQDEKRHIIWQCDDFDTAFAEVDIADLWKDRTRLFGYYLSQEKRYRSKVIKQADVLALLGVFPNYFTEEQKAASFHYYEPFTIHDSSNSMTHRQMVAANLNWKDEAYQSWLRSIDIDFGALPRSNDGLHYANVGGMWQQVVFGFGGLASALNEESLVFSPCIPEQIQRICFPLFWKGKNIRVTVTKNCVCVENLSQTDVAFAVGKNRYRVEPGLVVEARI